MVENVITFSGENFNVLDARFSIERSGTSIVRLMVGIGGEERKDLPDDFVFPYSRLKLEFDLPAAGLTTVATTLKISYVDRNEDAQNCFYIGEHLMISRVEGKFEYEKGLGKFNVSGYCGVLDEVYEFSVNCVAKEFPARDVWDV